VGAFSRGGLIRGRGLISSSAFSSKVDRKNELNKKMTKRLFGKGNLIVNNDFFIIITSVRIFLLLFLQ